MATATTPPPSKPATATPRWSLADIQTKGKGLPSRTVMHGVPGVGKTSFAACAPKPVFLMTSLETGLVSLIDSNLVPEVGYLPECKTWSGLLGYIEALTTENHDYRTLVIDVLNGAERLCHEYVCNRDFNANWTKYAAYGAGNDVAVADWRQLLSALDRLREVKRMMVVLLAHTKVKTFRNPEGLDYERYQPDMNDKTWSVTCGWSDIVLFGNYLTAIKEENKKAKAFGGDERFLYTTRTAAWDAKHRHSLPEMISMGASGVEAWKNFATEMNKKSV